MASTAFPLLDSPTALRRLSAEEAPYAGWLHSGASQTVWVELALIPDDAWRCDGGEHILVPLDVARDGDGHAAIVPHCGERLGDAARRSAHPGASVTIAVSVLRAASEARRHALARGTWWVDASGRPVLAPRVDGPEWRTEAVALLEGLARRADGPLSDALSAAGALLSRDRWGLADAATCEDDLFRAAEPVPLGSPSSPTVTSQPAPRRADSLRRGATPSPVPAPAPAWLAHVAGSGWAERLGEALRAVTETPARMREWRRRRRPAATTTTPNIDDAPTAAPPRRRRAPWLVAAAVGALVVAAGAMWPASETDARTDTAASTTSATSTTSPTSTATPPPTPAMAGEASAAAPDDPPAPPVEDASVAGDLDTAAAAVLAALSSCAEEDSRCAGLMEDAAAPLPTGIVAGGGPHSVSLLDEYGGVAVFRVEASDQPPQILVLVGVDGEWLIRDVYDVADQP